MNKNILVTAIVALILGGVVGFVVGNNDQPQLGSGTRFPNGISADNTSPSEGEVRGTTLTVTSTAGITGAVTFDGGNLLSSPFATSSAGTATYTAASITGISTVLHDATDALTATLPASTTLSSFLPTTGDRRSIVWVNVGDSTLTLSGGSGTLLKNASTTAAIPAGGAALLEFVRKADTDVTVFMSPAI